MEDLLIWEKLRECLNMELAAYHRLSELHGISVPRLFGEVTVPLRFLRPGWKRSCWPSKWTLDLDSVRGLPLEYVDGVGADTLKRGEHLSDLDAQRMCADAFQMMRDVTRLGVMHNDMRAADVLVRKTDMRPFFIDFCNANA